MSYDDQPEGPTKADFVVTLALLGFIAVCVVASIITGTAY
jgi:hypothetical protein